MDKIICNKNKDYEIKFIEHLLKAFDRVINHDETRVWHPKSIDIILVEHEIYLSLCYY